MTPTKDLPLGHRDPAHRIERGCDVCGVSDTGPRHVHTDADGSTSIKHMHCCNCTACVVQLDHANGKTGDELAAHLQEHGETLAKKVAAALPADDNTVEA